MSSNKNIPFFESEPKLSSSTFFTDKPSCCDSHGLDPSFLKQKLEEILFSLQHEIDLKVQQLENQRLHFKSSLQEKDDIIQRLVEANTTLSEENQKLKRIQNSDRQYFELQLNQYQQRLAAQNKQMNAVINYLELKNMQLNRRVNQVTSPKTPNTRYSQFFDSCVKANFGEQKNNSREASTTIGSTLKKVSSANFLLQPSFYHGGHTQSEIKNPSLRHLKKSRVNLDLLEKVNGKSRVSNGRASRNLHEEKWKESRVY